MSHIDIKPTSSGKVRDLYDLGDKLLFVASDRISAYDYVLPSEIPYKGEILTRLSFFWFDLLADVTDNHLLSSDVADLPAEFQPYADYLRGRFMLVKKADMLPAECIVRGYISGSAWKEYSKSGTVCGQKLPEGLRESEKFAETIFTPSTKAELGDHDENISYEQLVDIVGAEDAAELKEKSLAVYNKAANYAAERGIIIADTKFEFGKVDGKIILADEVLTPDSSRFWPADEYEVGRGQSSFDKQYVRDWLTANWDRTGTPPVLPPDVIAKTTEKYVTAYEMITGEKFEPMGVSAQ